MKLSERILHLQESKTVAFTPLLRKMRLDGQRIFDFAVGEPDFDTPRPVIEFTKKALDNLETRYGPVPGLPELRGRLAADFPGYGGDNILVANGSKMILYSIFQVILDPGDEVIVARPYWVSFVEQIKLAGGVPVIVETLDHQLDVRAVEKALTPRTKALIINSPNNPTGAVYPESVLREVLALAENQGIYVISDEAYDQFIYDGPDIKSLYGFGQYQQGLILVKSFSKTFNMTGFRIGYAVAPEPLIRSMARFQGHTSGNVCTFAQYGALGALCMDTGLLSWQKEDLKRKRDLAYQAVSGLFPCIRPGGAFYLFPDISEGLRKGETAEQFARDLLEKTGVAVVPGEAFGMDGHIRLSYAVPETTLLEGLERINGYVKPR